LKEDILVKESISDNDWILWDELCIVTKYVSFLSLSTWLGAYNKIPFVKKTLFVIKNNHSNRLIGGIAGLNVGFGRFKMLIFPSGPYVFGNENNIEKCREALIEHLSKIKCKIYLNIDNSIEINGFVQRRWRFKGIYTNPGIGLIDTSVSDFETLLIRMKAKTRRDIRASFRKQLEIHELKDTNEMKAIYNQFKENSLRNGYKIKPFWWYKSMWAAQIESGVSRFFYATKEKDVKGAIWVIKCGGAYHYLMGASKREKKDLLVGYRLQSEIMMLSIEERLDYYNISIGGPKSVEQFKDDFGRLKINLTKQYVGIFDK
jgi:hypothetical protein